MSTYLILGGTGKTGRRIAQQLAEAGHVARAAARTPGSAEPGIVPVHFDWDDASTWHAALDGADAVYLVPPAMRLDYPAVVGELLAAAKAAGAEKAVFLSARGGNLDPASPLAQVEALLPESGLAWSVLRPSWFAQNFTEAFLRASIDEGDAVVFPAGSGAEPFIDADDIAAVAVALLTESAHDGQGYDLSGPQALTFAQVTAVLAEVVGRPLQYVDVDPAEWRSGIIAAGVPEDYAGLLDLLASLIRDGHDAHLSDGVQRVLWREPGTFAAWAARDAGQLRRTATPA